MATQHSSESAVTNGYNGAEQPQGKEQIDQVSPAWSCDSNNPVNWSATRTWSIVILLWATNTVASIGSTAYEPALSSILADLGNDSVSLGSFSISVYVIGYCFGPLLVAPASELFGRVAVLYPSFVLYIVALAVCGCSRNITTLIIFRAIMGFAGITFIICGSAVIADIIPAHRRGLAVSGMTSSLTLGPTLGPIFGGFIAENLGWRWIFWISIICLGVLMLGMMTVFKETYPELTRLRWQKRFLSNDSNTKNGLANQEQQVPEVFRTAFTRPFRFIFKTRLIPLFTLYTSVVNSYLLILFSTLGTTFEAVQDFSPGESGLAYLGMTIGFLLSEIALGLFSDAHVARRARRRPGSLKKPEDHLYPLTYGSVLLPASLLLYGWALERKAMWLGPVVGSGLVAVASMLSYIPVGIYLVETYTLHTASVMGSMSVIRSVIAAIVPLGADPLYARLGYGWGYTVLALIAVPFIGIGMILVAWGERIRKLDASVR